MISPSLPDIFFTLYDRYRLSHLKPANCTPAVVDAELTALCALAPGIVTRDEAGRSTEGRSISQVGFGTGPRRILLWTQMHGDEPTATLAFLDLLRMLIASGDGPWASTLLHQVTVRCLVMLNPDGAERFQRHTAVNIDLNRDAGALATPEARILKEAHRAFLPEFAFNLHDQGLCSVGNTTRVAALALLAPPADEDRSISETRLRAMRVAAFVRQVLTPYVDGHLTRYADEYEARAFGDGMQAWGTSTVLLESGHWPGDPEKSFIRRLNAIALLSTMCALGDGSYEHTPLDLYFDLPPNGKRLYHIVVRNAEMAHPRGWRHRVDIGLNYAPRSNGAQQEWPSHGIVQDVGDLRGFAGLQELDAGGRSLPFPFTTRESIVPLSLLYEAEGYGVNNDTA